MGPIFYYYFYAIVKHLAPSFTYSSDGACRLGAVLIELEATLRHNEVVTCIGEKCAWKRRKRTHNEASNLEDMTFTKPEIGKKKKKAGSLQLEIMIHAQRQL